MAHNYKKTTNAYNNIIERVLINIKVDINLWMKQSILDKNPDKINISKCVSRWTYYS